MSKRQLVGLGWLHTISNRISLGLRYYLSVCGNLYYNNYYQYETQLRNENIICPSDTIFTKRSNLLLLLLL